MVLTISWLSRLSCWIRACVTRNITTRFRALRSVSVRYHKSTAQANSSFIIGVERFGELDGEGVTAGTECLVSFNG